MAQIWKFTVRTEGSHCRGKALTAAHAAVPAPPLQEASTRPPTSFLPPRAALVYTMPIYGLRFHSLDQTSYYLGPEHLQRGDMVFAPIEQREALGEIVCVCPAPPQGMSETALPAIIRRTTDEDISQLQGNKELSLEAAAFCRRCIRHRHLDMKLVDVEVFFDRSKFIFYFTAPARIDFRELVKDLVHQYRTRIELRQIGVRHETQLIGAVGNCGMVCCCRRYLRKFAPVTIRMAKEQNLFLNPAKISGICGRLLCCLSYEQENYDQFHRSCPRLGKKYHTRKGCMKVLRANMFRNSVSVLTENNEEMELTLDEWQTLESYRPDAPRQNAVKPAARTQAGDGLLVVSVTPDSVDDPALLASMLPSDPGQEPPAQTEEGKSRGKRKRRRKPRQDGEERQEAATNPAAPSDMPS